MKKVLLLSVLFIAACSSTKPMTRQDVASATRECYNAKLKPVIQHGVKTVDGSKIQVPLEVTCTTY
jgi:hypothetical protein